MFLARGREEEKGVHRIMGRSVGLWIAAVALTLGSAVYQRMTGPTYPVKGVAAIGGSAVEYELLRSHGGEGDQPVVIETGDTGLAAVLVYRRYKTDDEWTRVVMRREGKRLVASLPHQPPAGKLEYYLELSRGRERLCVPSDESVVTRFKGRVPHAVLVPHILFMFAAMLVSARTGLEALFSPERLKTYTLWSIGLLFAGGMILGPVVQKYAFGAFWTGFPFGTDLTDNKLLIAFVAWVVAAVAVYSKSWARGWVVIASLVTFTIFLVPHSMFGSELDYSKGDGSKIESGDPR